MKKLIITFVLCLLPTLAFAQNNQRNPCYYLTPANVDCQPVSPTTPLPVTLGSPVVQTPLVAGATGTTAATVATLLNVAGKTTYICGFSISANATVPTSGIATVTGPMSIMSFGQSVGTAPAIAGTSQSFNPCIPASAANTAILITSAAAGSGGSTTITAWGYQQ